jgi:hypothetical protein
MLLRGELSVIILLIFFYCLLSERSLDFTFVLSVNLRLRLLGESGQMAVT